jgi:Uma2 family endonuclease
MPDILVIRTEHLDRLREKWYEGPADFVTEFVSEDDPERDTVDKFREFELARVPEYLWVDARPGHRDFRYHRRGDDGYQLVEADADGRFHSLVLPGFWFRPDWFWQDPLPDAEDLMLEIAPEAYEAWITAKLQARRERSGS